MYDLAGDLALALNCIRVSHLQIEGWERVYLSGGVASFDPSPYNTNQFHLFRAPVNLIDLGKLILENEEPADKLPLTCGWFEFHSIQPSASDDQTT